MYVEPLVFLLLYWFVGGYFNFTVCIYILKQMYRMKTLKKQGHGNHGCNVAPESISCYPTSCEPMAETLSGQEAVPPLKHTL